ncbi:GNAT family N-acetyltransferase [Deinococcus sp.]|uniref:GNAT family N-acetyltransferase n=1 Tax=Deinococcus sp. TaxID=47478 RepID=UPI0025F9E955|nr:GNAT family N-acetyltransferase [Deinococcus sp.]
MIGTVAWDGGVHAFLLDTTVHPEFQRRGLGAELVRRVAAQAQSRGLHWLHVDFGPHLEGFYRGCGFRETGAGLDRLEARLTVLGDDCSRPSGVELRNPS